MTAFDMMQRINDATAPDKMTKREAYDWLSDLKGLIDGSLEALDEEMSEEEEEPAGND